MKRAAIILAATSLPLAGCASDTTNYPSLARRPVETVRAPAPPAPPPAATPPDTEVTARLAPLVEQARTAHRRFEEAQGRAERTVAAASGSAMGSESWAVASVALAGLESARSDAMIALADLDQMYAAGRIAGNDSSAIEAARTEVTGWIGEEDRVLGLLRGKLGG